MKKNPILKLILTTFLLVFFCELANAELSTRIKDITRINGIRENQLIGYGIVVGLEGSGDSSSKVAVKSIQNFLNSFGVKIDSSKLKGKNIAAVGITAKIPPFAKQGDNIDITVSSIGDAKSLQGGMLLLTPLKGADDQVYAVAQGPISIGGFNTQSGETEIRKNHSTIGRIPNGATVEKDMKPSFLTQKNTVSFVLKQPDFATATTIAKQINKYFSEEFASVTDPSTIEVYVPEEFREYLSTYIASIQKLEVIPDSIAKVVINERTGTILMGGPIKIMPVAVAHGNLTISIKTTESVSQPGAFSSGSTAITKQTNINVQEGKGRLVPLKQAGSLNDVVRILNTIGASPRDMITILQSMKNAGALKAELEII